MRELTRIAAFLPFGVAALSIFFVARVIEIMRDLISTAARMCAHSPAKRR